MHTSLLLMACLKFSHERATGIFSCNFYDENAVLMYAKLSLKPINTSLKKGHIQT